VEETQLAITLAVSLEVFLEEAQLELGVPVEPLAITLAVSLVELTQD
jgi:hypothetical protein